MPRGDGEVKKGFLAEVTLALRSTGGKEWARKSSEGRA